MNAIEQLRQFRRNIERFQSSLPEIVLDSVKRNEHTILDLNTDEQLLKQGIDRDGDPISPAYRPLTISIKQSKGQPTDRVTLKDTGDFHRSFFVSYGADSFAIGASDEKSQSLQRKYGTEIFGLTDASLQEATEEMKTDIFEISRKMILQ